MIKAATRENFPRNNPPNDKSKVDIKTKTVQEEFPQLNNKYAGDFSHDKWTEFL